MENRFSRSELLLGQENMKRLAQAKVAVFGVGGVGGYVVEALARTGVGAFVLVDHDTVSLSNLNRQIIATQDTLGRFKVDAMRERILSINPKAQVECLRCFYLPENAEEFDFSQYSYVVDAVDTVTAKLAIIMRAQKAGVPVISSMGAGNKLDPTRFEVADIYETSVCPLAKVMRRELKKRGVRSLKVVYSKEQPLTPLATERMAACTKEPARKDIAAHIEAEAAEDAAADVKKPKTENDAPRKKQIPGSVAFVPSVAGLTIAGEVVRDLAFGRSKS